MLNACAKAIFIFIKLLTILMPVIIGWQIMVTFFSVPHYILPTPLQVLTVFYNQSNYLFYHTIITVIEILLGLFFGSIFAIFSSLMMAFSVHIARLLFPIILVTQALPIFAIAPLLVLWLGYGLAPKLVMTVLIIYFPITSAFFDGLRRSDNFFGELGHIYGATRMQSLIYLKVPSALPSLTTGLRVAATLAPIGAVVGEWVGASEGLGFVMIRGNSQNQIDIVFAALFLLAAFVLLLRFLLEYTTHKALYWVDEDKI